MISIIVSFYERLAHLKSCLDSLALCVNDFDEVVVTDDGSCSDTVDKLKECIKRYDFPINHVWQPKKGFRVAAARNNGIRHARGEYLIFFDCDFLVLPGAIKQHVKCSKNGWFVAGHCKYLPEDQTGMILDSTISPDLLENLYRQFPDRPIIKSHRRFIKRTILMRFRLTSHRKQSLGGHFSIFLRDIGRINGYDENFMGWGGEDEDLGIRLVRAGIYCRSAIRSARVLHLWHPKQIGNKHWKQAPNIEYFRRKEIPVFCENGLRKASTNPL